MNSNENTNIIGERLKMLRSLKKYKKQGDFAKELDIPQPTLSAYEKGKIKPTIDALIKIADKCGVSLDWLCGRDYVSHLNTLGDVLSCFTELYETEQFSIQTIIHIADRTRKYDDKENENRNYVELKVYRNDGWGNENETLGRDLYEAITRAYMLTNNLIRYEVSQEDYERDKKHFISYMGDVPITKIDHSNITEEERRKQQWQLYKKEMEAMEKEENTSD